MRLFRICHAKWSTGLKASGMSARWNSRGKLVIYTAESRSLACLENLVHRSGLGKNDLFKVVVINTPDDISIKEINISNLSRNWREFSNYTDCQRKGDQWIESMDSCLLKVPSAVIPQEYNLILNTLHKEFSKIEIDSVEDFSFDRRMFIT